MNDKGKRDAPTIKEVRAILGDIFSGSVSDEKEYIEKKNLCDRLDDKRKKLIEQAAIEKDRALELRQECAVLFLDTSTQLEQYNIYSAAFHSESGIFFYFDAYADFVKEQLSYMEKISDIELLAYNSILFGLSLKIQNLRKELSCIAAVDEASFDAKYDVVLNPKQPGTVYVRDRNLEDLKRYKKDLKNNSSEYQEYLSHFEALVKRLSGVKEELENRAVFLRNNIRKNYSVLFDKLSLISFDSYKAQDGEDLDAYKSRLVTLAGEIQSIYDMWEAPLTKGEEPL